MKLIILTLATISTLSIAHAETTSRNSVEMGMTNNAYLTKTNPTSDTYLRLSTSNGLTRANDRFGLRASFTEYFKANENDLFSLRLSDRRTGGSWNYTGALFTNIYTAGAPGTTDNAFTNVGGEFAVDRDKSWGSASLNYGGGYRLRYFTDLDGRNDHTIFGMATFDKEVTAKLSLGAYTETGLLVSSLSEYSRLYFDIGGTLDYLLPADWTLSGDVMISQSYFLNRTVTTQTQVGRNRGVGVSGTRSSAETYSSFYLSAEGMRQQTAAFQWGGGIYMTNQASASGSLDYSVVDILGRLTLSF